VPTGAAPAAFVPKANAGVLTGAAEDDSSLSFPVMLDDGAKAGLVADLAVGSSFLVVKAMTPSWDASKSARMKI